MKSLFNCCTCFIKKRLSVRPRYCMSPTYVWQRLGSCQMSYIMGSHPWLESFLWSFSSLLQDTWCESLIMCGLLFKKLTVKNKYYIWHIAYSFYQVRKARYFSKHNDIGRHNLLKVIKRTLSVWPSVVFEFLMMLFDHVLYSNELTVKGVSGYVVNYLDDISSTLQLWRSMFFENL